MESQTTLAVIVLYRVAAEASQAFCSLRSLMGADPQAAAAIDLMLFDNSPQPQPRPAGYTGPHIPNPVNPGLAACWIVVSKDGKFLYDSNSATQNISVFSIRRTTVACPAELALLTTSK